jgi:hypothetical protein
MPKDVKKACVLYERIQHGSKSQFGSEEEEQLYRDYFPRRTIFQIFIASCSKLKIEHGSRSWKDLEK